MKIKLIPATPTGSMVTKAFGTDEERRDPLYTPSAEALRFRQRWAELNLTPAAAARRLGLSSLQVQQIGWGELVPADPADWPRLVAALEDQDGRGSDPNG